MGQVTKKQIALNIAERLALPPKDVKDAISILLGELRSELEADVPIRLKNFGTLSPYVFHGHLAWNVQRQGYVDTPPFRSVRFHPADRFLRLLRSRRAKFLGAPKKA